MIELAQVYKFGCLYAGSSGTNYLKQLGNVDSDIYCPHLKQHETMKLKN